ncbi:MAG TPA: FAD-dependent thymidylate synthase [Methylomirabilota bacterium]|nr:FAD-dependent thymidylate synthase [Methylomirabilota bacterium]
MTDQFSPDERARLAPYFTNLDAAVFALVNLPEVVKGALFARYSRSPKSLRRLFLDEFLTDRTTTLDSSVRAPRANRGGDGGDASSPPSSIGRAEQLYEKVFFEYGDDSVAQLGGVHLAVEGASNILTKVLEWGRLMAYLEQSTRYIPYDDRPGGRYRYHVPDELTGPLRERYVDALDHAFGVYREWLPRVRAHFEARHPREAGESEGVYRSTIRAKALDTLRGLLPAATVSNVGIYGTGQAWEQLLLRMRSHPLAEVRACAEAMLVELRKVIPAFLKRVDLPDRGGAWSAYLAETRAASQAAAARALATHEAETARALGGLARSAGDEPDVMLTDFDPDGEIKVVAAALYAVTDRPDHELLAVARALTAAQRADVLRAYVGRRGNRRHKPGRAFERTAYRFDVLSDYGAFRDLQRHRLLTLEWQRLSPQHGWVMPEAVAEAGAAEAWRVVMEEAAELHEAIAGAGLPEVASYAVSMAYRVRFYMEMNAREAMHVIELRTAPQGHPAYRRVGQAMHRLIAEQAGHRAIAAAMSFADHSEVALERLEAERAAERRRAQT